MFQNPRVLFRKIPLVSVLAILALCLLTQGFASSPSIAEKQQTNQEKANRSTKSIKVAPGVTLRVQAGTIVDVSVFKQREHQSKWRGLVGSKYVVGDLHATDVTPPLWRKLEVQLRKRDHSIAEISMLRPLWWLQLTKAREGGYLDLSVPEAGLKGTAKVIKISSCHVDSRKTKKGHNVVIGKIKHHNARTIQILFVDSKSKLGITQNHLLFSLNRDKWVSAGSLKKGDKLKTANGIPAVIKSVTKRARATVYNLEVHRAKSYYVGQEKILAHNTGIDSCDDWVEVGRWMHPDELKAMKDSGRVQFSPSDRTHRVTFPANSDAYKAAPKGDIFATYEVPLSSLHSAGTAGWRQIPGPGHIIAKLMEKKGIPVVQPEFRNLVEVLTKQ